MAMPKSKSVAQIDVTPLPIHERSKLATKHDYKNIKHPSTIKLISVVKTDEVPQIENDKWVGLTKYELMEYLNDPLWVKVRSLFLTLFIVTFISIFTAAMLIIVYSPKCQVQSICCRSACSNNSTNGTDLNQVTNVTNLISKNCTLHATCTSDSQCSEGLFCKPMNATGGANTTKICMCPEEINGGQCSGAFSVSANILSVLAITLTAVIVNHWHSLTYPPF